MNLIITGGAGFLGYHLANILGPRFEKIIIFDTASIHPGEYPSNHLHVKGDVRDIEALRKIMTAGDIVIHTAAALPLCSDKEILDVNVNGTERVLSAAMQNTVNRVIYVSSTAVYGVPLKHPIYEDDPLVGVGPYGISKIKAEELCCKYRNLGLCVSIIRPKTFIGTGRLGVFQILYDWIHSGARIPVIGSGKNRYQLLEVDDLCKAIELLCVSERELINDVFNVGAQTYGTVRADLDELCLYAKSGSTVMTTPAAPIKLLLCVFERLKLSPLYKWVYATADKDSYVSTDKIKNRLGWNPLYSNAQALIRSYRWYLEHFKELTGSGVTHRVAWKQGILSIAKRILKT